MEKQRSEIRVEPKDQPAYDTLPQEARDVFLDALLILIARGREVLAGQLREQIELKELKGARGQR